MQAIGLDVSVLQFCIELIGLHGVRRRTRWIPSGCLDQGIATTSDVFTEDPHATAKTKATWFTLSMMAEDSDARIMVLPMKVCEDRRGGFLLDD